MLDIAKTLTASASVHALAGSSQPGAVPPFAPIIAAAADQPTAPHLDADLIDLAGRVVALARRDHRLWDRRAAIEDAVDAELPALPPQPLAPSRGTFQEVEADGVRITTITTPLEPDPAYVAAVAAHDAAVEERNRFEAEMEARLGYPRWEKLSKRTFARLVRWTERLAPMQPRTENGLQAKAKVQSVLAATGNSGRWTTGYAVAVGRDAIRMATALAAEGHPDAELLALGRAWETSRLRIERSCDAYEAAAERFEQLDIPEALLCRDADRTGLGPYPIQDVRTDQWFFGDEMTIATLRANARSGHASARHVKIVEAYDRWTAACVAEQERCGLVAARAENNAALREGQEIRARICLMPAHTPAGVELKMRVVLWCLHGIEGLASDLTPENVEDPATGATLALSLVLDLARQREQRAALPNPSQIASAA